MRETDRRGKEEGGWVCGGIGRGEREERERTSRRLSSSFWLLRLRFEWLVGPCRQYLRGRSREDVSVVIVKDIREDGWIKRRRRRAGGEGTSSS